MFSDLRLGAVSSNMVSTQSHRGIIRQLLEEEDEGVTWVPTREEAMAWVQKQKEAEQHEEALARLQKQEEEHDVEAWLEIEHRRAADVAEPSGKRFLMRNTYTRGFGLPDGQYR